MSLFNYFSICETYSTLSLSVIRAILVELVDQLLRKVCTLG